MHRSLDCFVIHQTPEPLGKRRQNTPTVRRASSSRLPAIMERQGYHGHHGHHWGKSYREIMEELHSRLSPLKSVNGTSCVGRSGSAWLCGFRVHPIFRPPRCFTSWTRRLTSLQDLTDHQRTPRALSPRLGRVVSS